MNAAHQYHLVLYHACSVSENSCRAEMRAIERQLGPRGPLSEPGPTLYCAVLGAELFSAHDEQL